MLITEAMLKSKTTTPTDKRQLLASKLKSQNLYLSALLQKRYRLDLEIKRQGRVLQKNKSDSAKLLRETIQDLVPNHSVPLSQEQLITLKESVSEKELQVLEELDRQVDDTVRTLQEISDLKLAP
jgi:hypothetical protein